MTFGSGWWAVANFQRKPAKDVVTASPGSAFLSFRGEAVPPVRERGLPLGGGERSLQVVRYAEGMASPDLRRLWALHEIDAQILDLKRRAARLDAGFAEAAKLKELEAKDATAGEAARALVAEQLDT